MDSLGFTDEFHPTFRELEPMTPIFCDKEKTDNISMHFIRQVESGYQKPDKDYTKKKNYRPIPLGNTALES